MTALPQSLHEVIDAMLPLTERFEAADHRLYLVGGAVRDHLRGRPQPDSDLDATTDARPDAIKALLDDLASAMWTQGERFGTVGVVVAGRSYEITTHRAEIYQSGSRKPQVRFGDDLVEDLSRRDFTINAMAVDLASRTLVDPYGGAADLENGMLRTPLGPEVSFSEDPLRMLRAARFCARYQFAADKPLLEAIPRMLGRMEIVSAERIRDELERLLLLPSPAAGLTLLADTGLLAQVIPPLRPTIGESARWENVVARIEAARTDPAHRWAALLSDVERPAAAAEQLRMSLAMRRTIQWLVAGRDLPTLIDEPVLRLWAAGSPAGHAVEEILDFAGRREECRERLAALRQAEPDLDDPSSPLNGLEVAAALGVAPGPVVGEAMKRLACLRIEQGPLSAAQARAALSAWQAESAEQAES